MTRWVFECFMRARARKVVARLAPWLPERGRLLDYGCGTGHNAGCLRAATALEVLEMDVAELKLVGPPATLVDGVIPLEDSAVEAGVLLFVLSYAADPGGVFRELRRVTGGHLIVLQSVCREPRFRRLLWVREVLEGGFAWDVARCFRWVRRGREGLVVRQVFDRAGLAELALASGWILVRHVPEGRWFPGRWLSRDLFVFEPVPCAVPAAVPAYGSGLPYDGTRLPPYGEPVL